MNPQKKLAGPMDTRFYIASGFLILAFLIGGGSRSDILSLALLRPIAVLACGYALWTMSMDTVRANRFKFWMIGAVFALVIVHLIPLPPSLWSKLPGRELAILIDSSTGLEGTWRPISLVPAATWNALFALFVPLAAFLLVVQMRGARKEALLPLFIGIGMLSGIVGVLQTAGDPNGPLYFYRYTNSGAAVGLFANRNHQAILLACLFPMLAVFAVSAGASASQARLRRWGALVCGLLLVPLLLVTGSRAGLVSGAIALMAALLIYNFAPSENRMKVRGAGKAIFTLGVAGSVAALTALTIWMSRAEALNRLTAHDQFSDLRFRIWGHIADMSWQYFPIGSGIGSFVEVYQIGERSSVINHLYVNHAHNDWLELLMTGGAAAVLILLVGLAAFAVTLMRTFGIGQGRGKPRNLAFSWMGATVLTVLMLGSIGDYPLRTPALSCLFVVAIFWMEHGLASRHDIN